MLKIGQCIFKIKTYLAKLTNSISIVGKTSQTRGHIPKADVHQLRLKNEVKLVTTILDALHQVFTHSKEMVNVLFIALVALKKLHQC